MDRIDGDFLCLMVGGVILALGFTALLVWGGYREDLALTRMVESGANPIAAKCAMSSQAIMRSEICKEHVSKSTQPQEKK